MTTGNDGATTMQRNEFKRVIDRIAAEAMAAPTEGEVASYIPQLRQIDASKFGLHLIAMDGFSYGVGDHNEPFSIQSIAKVFTMTLAFELLGERLWDRVGVEPSGSAFNSVVQLELEHGIPRNPMLNAGALVVCDVLSSHLSDPKQDVLDLVRSLAGDNSIDFNRQVAESERKSGFRNIALINLMRDFGNIYNDPDQVLDTYFHICSIEMSCAALAQAFMYLANDGTNPLDDHHVVNVSKSKRINAITQLCGFYDEAGEFSFRVGLPGKSGVGGGIVAVQPDQYSVAVWSPPLNAKGNSAKGLVALEALTTQTGTSIF